MATIVMSFSSCKRIDAAHEGMKFNLYGNKKGVDTIAVVNGMVWYNPFTQRVYQYPYLCANSRFFLSLALMQMED